MKAVFITSILGLVISSSAFSAGWHEGNHHSSNPGGHSSIVGEPANIDQVTKTIYVGMLDSMKFTFTDDLNIYKGDVVRFVVKNKGTLQHEFSIGSEEEQKAHAEMMRKMPEMVHQDGNTLSVSGGEEGELIWRFDGEPFVVISCNIPGHAEAGMKLTYQLDET